jgi:Ser/Thr protein kinase RdoA (MazF antagonist)
MADGNPTGDPLDVVQPIHDPMSEEELAALLAHYPEAGTLKGRIRDSGRPYSAGTLVETTAGRFFLKKRSCSFRPRGDVLWRHRLISHLVAQGFPTPPILANAEGRTLTERDGFCYELFAAAQGEDRYREYHSWMPFERTEHARAAGEMLARFHVATRGFSRADATPPGRSPRTPMSARFDLAVAPDLLGAVEARIAASEALSAYFAGIRWKDELSGLYLDFHRELRRYLPGTEPAVTHGDWHANNMLFDGDAVASVIDFHLADVSFRAYDLAVALDRNGIRWLDILAGQPDAVRYDVLEELLRGYGSVLPLSMVEAELLGALLPIHQLDLALSNVEYYLVHEGKPERADWAYGVYLRDHTRHFLTPAGQRILTFVRQAAAAASR